VKNTMSLLLVSWFEFAEKMYNTVYDVLFFPPWNTVICQFKWKKLYKCQHWLLCLIFEINADTVVIIIL